VRESPVLEAERPDLLHAVKANGLEGLVAKRWNSRYEPGQRTEAWLKYRVNQGREFVIGGCTPGPRGFDAVVVGTTWAARCTVWHGHATGSRPRRGPSFTGCSWAWRLRPVRSSTYPRRTVDAGAWA